MTKGVKWLIDNDVSSLYPNTMKALFFPDVVYGKWTGGTQVKLYSDEAKEFVRNATGGRYDYSLMNLSNDDPLLSMILLKFPKDGA